MRLGQIGWMVFLTGLPFAHFLRHDLDIWHAQTWWAHCWIVALWAFAMSERVQVPANRPLMAWIAWVGLVAMMTWTKTIAVQRTYPLPMLPALMNCLLLVLGYQAAMALWSEPFLRQLMRGISIAGVVVLVYCGLQLLRLDQFYLNIDRQYPDADVLVGTIGNPTHLGAYLVLLLPCLLLEQTWWTWCATLATCGLIVLTQSSSAIVVMFLVLIWMSWPHSKPLAIGLVMIGGIAAVLVWRYFPAFLNPEGRWEVWKAFWPMLQGKAILGAGPGFVMEYSRTITSGLLYKWRHLHNEYYQLALEQGIVGLVAVGWMLIDIVRRGWAMRAHPLVWSLLAVLGAFCALASVNFVAHLWVVGSFALVAYCGLLLLSTEHESEWR